MGQGIEVHSVLKGIPPPKLYDYLSATSDVHFKGDNLLHLIEENRRMRVLISSIKLDIFFSYGQSGQEIQPGPLELGK